MEYMTNERQIELLKQLSEETAVILKYMGMADVWELRIESESGCDPLFVIGDTGICISAYLNTKKPKGQQEWFCLGHTVYDPGVRYHPDGSGTPPSEDFVEDDFVRVDNLQKAVDKVVKFILHFVFSEATNARAEDKMFEEMEEDKEIASQLQEKTIYVTCTHCKNRFDEVNITTEDISEDMEGRDVVVFVCPECGKRTKSLRIG